MFNLNDEDNSECTARIMINKGYQNFLLKLGSQNIENPLKRSPSKLEAATSEPKLHSKKLKLEMDVESKNIELISIRTKMIELESKLQMEKQNNSEKEILHEGLINKLKSQHQLEIGRLKSSENELANSKQILKMKHELSNENNRKPLMAVSANNDAILKQNLQMISEIENLKVKNMKLEKELSDKVCDLENFVKQRDDEIVNTSQLLNDIKSLRIENTKLKTCNQDLSYQLSTAQQKIKELEHEFDKIDADQKQSRHIRSEVQRLKNIEMENLKLIKENDFIKATQKNTCILEEKLLSANSKLKENDDRLIKLESLEFENKSLSKSLNAFKELMDFFPANEREPEKMIKTFTNLQQESKFFQMAKGEIQTKAKMLTVDNLKLSSKLEALDCDFKNQNEKLKRVEDKNKQLAKTANYLRMERDKLKEIIDSFDENFAHNMSFIAHDSKDDLHNKMDVLRADLSNIHSKRCEDLELEVENLTKWLQKAEQNINKKDRLSSKTSENIQPIETNIEDSVLLDLRIKVENLTKQNEQIMRENEENKMLIQWLENQGIHDPRKTQIICLTENPAFLKKKNLKLEIDTLKAQNAKLSAKIDLIKSSEAQSPDLSVMAQQKAHENIETDQIIHDLKTKLAKVEITEQRLKDAFKIALDDMRTFISWSLGYKLDVVDTRKYKLMSIFAETKHDYLHFTMTKDGLPTLIDSKYCQLFPQLIDRYLKRNKSIPMFMAGLTVELFNRQTMIESNFNLSDATQSFVAATR